MSKTSIEDVYVAPQHRKLTLTRTDNPEAAPASEQLDVEAVDQLLQNVAHEMRDRVQRVLEEPLPEELLEILKKLERLSQA